MEATQQGPAPLDGKRQHGIGKASGGTPPVPWLVSLLSRVMHTEELAGGEGGPPDVTRKGK